MLKWDGIAMLARSLQIYLTIFSLPGVTKLGIEFENIFHSSLTNRKYFFANFTQGYLLYLKIMLLILHGCSFSEGGLVTSGNFLEKAPG